MRFDIPSKVALACVLISGAASANPINNYDDVENNTHLFPAAAYESNYHTSTVHPIAHKSASLVEGNFTCNEPFMIPAEYVDSEGHPFAMCFSDPRFSRKQVIWYIQSMRDSYKAIGVAQGNGGARGSFVGSVIPIEQPAERTGMHAEPVQVIVNVDQAAGVITVKPRQGRDTLVNWIIRPNGFPPGSLQIPNSCGPFLETLKSPKLLAPLTGAAAGSKAKACIIHGQRGDAFISWGEDKKKQKHHAHKGAEYDINPFDEYDRDNSRFFTLGFVGRDRGITIDICDPGHVDAGRCEMSRLVGNNRKTFIVGGNGEHQPPHDNLFAHTPFDEQYQKEIAAKKHKKRHHQHRDRDESELVQKIETIERSLERLIEQQERPKLKLKEPKKAHAHAHARYEEESFDSDVDRCEVKPHPHRRHPKPVRKHKEKHCSVQHPLLYPREEERRPLPVPLPPHPHPQPALRFPPRHDADFNQLYQRLQRLEARIQQSEAIMIRRLAAFNQWLARQMRSIQSQAGQFKRFLGQLQADVVYTPKKSKNKLVSFVGKTFRGVENGVENVSDSAKNAFGSTANAVTGATDATLSAASSFGSGSVNLVGNVTDSAANTVGNVVADPLGSVGSTVDSAVNTVGNTLGGAVNTLGSTVNSVGNTAGGAVSSVGNTVGGAVGGTVNTVDNLAGSLTNPATNYFDFNDDLVKPPVKACKLAKSPSVQTVAQNPLGPVGPVMMPPPAVKKFSDEDTLRAAIDYLN